MAVRATVRGRVQGVGFREFARARALELGLAGWVRNQDDGAVWLHAEGAPSALDALVGMLRVGPAAGRVDHVETEPVPDEGHEQFAFRGVAAGRFTITLHRARSLHYDLRLEVNHTLRSWAIPREPSMDPSVKRLAIEGPDHDLSAAPPSGADVEIWDGGSYEQGGRVAWPEALERGHAVFVLHGSRLEGGFALQRTQDARADGAPAQWLLIKRRETTG